MYKSVRMGCREAYLKCKTIAVPYDKDISYESVARGMREGYAKYRDDEEIEFALFIKSSNLNGFYTNTEFNDYFDPASHYETMKYGYLGCLLVTMSNGTEWPCYLYTDASPNRADQFLELSTLRISLTDVPDVTEAVAALRKGDESVLRKMVDDRAKQL